MTLWPPRDAHNQMIVRRALATPRKTPETPRVSQQPWIFMEAPGKVLRSSKFSTPQSSGGSRDLEHSGGPRESSTVRATKKHEVSEARKKKLKEKRRDKKLEKQQAQTTKSKKKKKKKKKANSEFDRDEGKATLVVTVDGSGAKTIVSSGGEESRRPSPSTKHQQQRKININISPSSSLAHRPTSLLKTPLSPPNHIHPGGAKRPLLVAPHSGTRGDFPRETLPHHHHSPSQPYNHHHQSLRGDFYPPEPSPLWDRLGHSRTMPYGDTPPHYHHGHGGGEEWYSDSFDHTPSPSFVDPGMRYSRSFSFDDPHVPPVPQRRFSEQLEHKPRRPHPHHHSGTHPQGATPSHSGGGHMRGEVLSSSRGFQMSEQRARQTGHYQSPRDRPPAYDRRTSYNQRY